MKKNFGWVVCLAVAACGGGSEAQDGDYGEVEGAKRIKPKDGESLGSLLVELPANVSVSAQNVGLYFNAQSVAVGTPKRMNPIKSCLGVRGNSNGQVTSNKCEVELERGKTTKVKLSALELKYDPQVLSVHLGPTPQPGIWHKTNGVTEEQVAQPGTFGVWVSPGQTAQQYVVADGDYRVGFGISNLSDISLSVAPGAILTQTLAIPDKRGFVKATKAVRELPNAGSCPNFYVVARKGAYGQGDPLAGVVSQGYFTLDAETKVAMFPYQGQDAAHYEVVLHDVVQPIDVKEGKTVALNLERIDVDDVEVTTENGETRNVRGTWQAFRAGPGNSWLPLNPRDASCNYRANMSFYTNSGIDVLPGTYKVVVTYATAEGNKTQEHVISVP